jgi:PKD repeat protein
MISVSNGGPTASFDADPLAGVAPLDVQFNDHSTGVILTRFWDFGDGQTSLESSPLHQYQNPGTYTVTLAVVGLVGVDTLRRVDYIVVNEPPPVAGFSANQTTGLAPLDVQFTNSSTGTIDSFEWDFGDGNGSVDKEPLHTYQDPGVYSVRLIVVGPGGADTTRITDYISVLALDGAGRPTNSSKPTIQRSNADSTTPTPSAATITRKE